MSKNWGERETEPTTGCLTHLPLYPPPPPRYPPTSPPIKKKRGIKKQKKMGSSNIWRTEIRWEKSGGKDNQFWLKWVCKKEFALPKHWGSSECCTKTWGRKAESLWHEGQKPRGESLRVNWMWQKSFFLLRGKWGWNRKPGLRDRDWRQQERQLLGPGLSCGPAVDPGEGSSAGGGCSLLQAAVKEWAGRGILWGCQQNSCW